MGRELCSFPLSPKQLSVLRQGGFVQDTDVAELSPSQLAEGIIIFYIEKFPRNIYKSSESPF